MEYKNVKEGSVVTGTVYQVKDGELVITIEGYPTEGTIHKEFLTKERITSAKELYKVGDKIEAVVRKKDDEHGILLLSCLEIEQKKKFDQLQDYFAQETVFEALVKGVNKGGLVLTAMEHEMFMPASEVSMEFQEDFSIFVNQTLKVKISEIRRNKIVVSHKMVEREVKKEQKAEELETITEGDVLEGKVVKIMPFGAFIRFNQVEGLLHISEISHHKTNQVSDVLKEGETVTVKVIQAKNNKRSLSMKALQKTPWEQFADAHKVGDQVTGKIVKKMQFGMLVEVSRDVAGIINRNDYSWNPRLNLAGEVNVGDTIDVKILSMDVKHRKMQLSKKHLEYNPWEDVKVRVGESVSGEVKELQSNGALIEVQGVNAFLPIAEIQEERTEKPQDVLKLEQVIKATVIKFNPQNWQMVLSKKTHDEKQVRDEYKKYLRSENKEDQSQTLGELFADKFKQLKK